MILVTCVYTLISILPNGVEWREYPLLKGQYIRSSNGNLHVDFSEGLSELKYNHFFNDKVQVVHRSLCSFEN